MILLPTTSIAHLHLACLPRPDASHFSICIASPSHPPFFIALATILTLLLALIISLIVGLLCWLVLREKRDPRGAEKVIEGVGAREEWLEMKKKRRRKELDGRLEEMSRREREEGESDSDEESEVGDPVGIDIKIDIKLWGEVDDDEASNHESCGFYETSTASDHDTSFESSPSPFASPEPNNSPSLDPKTNTAPQNSSPRIKLTDHPFPPSRCPLHPARKPYLSTTNSSLPPGVFTLLGFTAPRLTAYLREISAEQNPYKIRALISDLSVFSRWVEFDVKPSLVEAENLEARVVRGRLLSSLEESVDEEWEEMRYIKMHGREKDVYQKALKEITEVWDIGRLRRVLEELREKVRWEEEVIGPVLWEARKAEGRFAGTGEEGFQCCREWMPSEIENGDDEHKYEEVVEVITDCPLWMFQDDDDDYADYAEENEDDSVFISTHCCPDSYVLTGSSLCQQYEIITPPPSDEDHGPIEPITKNRGFTRCHSASMADEKPEDNSETEVLIAENADTDNSEPTNSKESYRIECTATNSQTEEPTPYTSTTQKEQ